MRVEVYWNLHKDCFSVRALEGPDKGRVIKHVTDEILVLSDVTFAVGRKGRERVLRERCKNVHAFVRGTLRGLGPDDEPPLLVNPMFVTYNPYYFDHFVTVNDHHPVTHSTHVMCWVRGDGKPAIQAQSPRLVINLKGALK